MEFRAHDSDSKCKFKYAVRRHNQPIEVSTRQFKKPQYAMNAAPKSGATQILILRIRKVGKNKEKQCQ